jgi:tetratricopeptide (TPR) repeat protein
MLLLVNYRPEYGHRWGSKTYYTQLRLDALAPESAETLLDALLGGDASPARSRTSWWSGRRAIPSSWRKASRRRATGLPLMLPALASMLGLAHSLSGRHAEGLLLLEEAVQLRARAWVHSSPLVCLAEGYLLAGRVSDAGRLAMQALDLARARGERGMEARTLWLLGEILIRGDASADLEAASERYEQARTLATELNMRPLVAHCYLGLGMLYRRSGDQAKSREHLTTAATMYREMGMTFWLEKADAELRGVER